MTREIGGVGERRDQDLSNLTWRPWQPPVMPPQPHPGGGESDAVGGVSGPSGARGTNRIALDTNGTGELAAAALGRMNRVSRTVDLEKIDVPLTPELQRSSEAIHRSGAVGAIQRVSSAVSAMPLAPARLSEALGHFTDTFVRSSAQLTAIPGLGDALHAYGGVTGVVAGASGLKKELDDVKARGLGREHVVGIAARAAQLVGGVAMAMSTLCPSLASVGAAVLTAGAALSLGRLALANRDGSPARIISNNGGTIQDGPARIVSNNSGRLTPQQEAPVRIVSEHGAGMMRQDPWKWVTSGT